MKFNPDHHHRRSIRLPGYDYSQPGAYFVTICTRQRECSFGTVQDRVVVLSEIGKIVQQCWYALPKHFLFIDIDSFVIMPNHLHGIVIINEYGQDSALAPSDGTRANSLSAIVQNFKSVSTRKSTRMLQNRTSPIWQRGYYERIIRDETEINQVREYIETNPVRWKNTI
jgi:putative transposase